MALPMVAAAQLSVTPLCQICQNAKESKRKCRFVSTVGYWDVGMLFSHFGSLPESSTLGKWLNSIEWY